MTNASGPWPRTLIFDVNETLLDVEALAPLFEEFLEDRALVHEWFAHMLLYSETVTLAGPYADFSTLARSSLEMTARMHGVALGEEEKRAVLKAIRSIPAHSDVPGALQRLHDRGFRLVAFTNSTQAVVEAQLRTAGIADLFAKIMSVDALKRYKPDPAVYLHVSAELGIDPGLLTMIAAHPWDLMGARAAGLQIAFVERRAGSWFPLVERPQISGPTLAAIADQLLERRAAA